MRTPSRSRGRGTSPAPPLVPRAPRSEPDVDVTTELRWFGSGAVPADAADWFGVAEPHAGRIDWYASAGAAAGLGLKVRAGSSLELKARRDEVGVWSFGERASGLVQTWVKWAVPLDPGWDGRSLGQGWIAV